MNPTGELEKKALAGTFTRLRKWIQKYFHNHTQTEVTQERTRLTSYDHIRLENLRIKTARIRGYHNNIHNSSEVVPEQSYSESD
ncbi:MAG: hypothetical protein FVQ80_17120 [Planctomycetes bacterium]|nr:hypothetical protein [Planctomycetota bacterium]